MAEMMNTVAWHRYGTPGNWYVNKATYQYTENDKNGSTPARYVTLHPLQIHTDKLCKCFHRLYPFGIYELGCVGPWENSHK